MYCVLKKVLVIQVGFGGHGYAHIFTNVVPKMLMKGLTQEDVDLLSIENPKRWLSY